MALPTLRGSPYIGTSTGIAANTLALSVYPGDIIVISSASSTDSGTIAVTTSGGAALAASDLTSLTLGAAGNAQIRVAGPSTQYEHFWTLKATAGGTVTLTPNYTHANGGRLIAEVWAPPSGHHWDDNPANRIVAYSKYSGTANTPNGDAWSSTPPTDVPLGMFVMEYASGSSATTLAVDDNGDGANYWTSSGPGGGSVYRSGNYYCAADAFYDVGDITWGSYCGFANTVTGNKVDLAVIIKTIADYTPSYAGGFADTLTDGLGYGRYIGPHYAGGFADTLTDGLGNARIVGAQKAGGFADTLSDTLGNARKFSPVEAPRRGTGQTLYLTNGDVEVFSTRLLTTENEGDLIIVAVSHAAYVTPTISFATSGCTIDDIHLDLIAPYPEGAMYTYQWSGIIRNVSNISANVQPAISGLTNPNRKAIVISNPGEGYWGTWDKRVNHTGFSSAADGIGDPVIYTPGSDYNTVVPIDKACVIFATHYRKITAQVPKLDLNGDNILETTGPSGIGGGSAFWSTESRPMQVADAYFDERGTSQGILLNGVPYSGHKVSAEAKLPHYKLFTAVWYTPGPKPHYAIGDTLTDALGNARGPSAYHVGGNADTLTDAKGRAIPPGGIQTHGGIASTITWAYDTNRGTGIGRDLVKTINDGIGVVDLIVGKQLESVVIDILPMAIMMVPDSIPHNFKLPVYVEAIDNVLTPFPFDAPGPLITAYAIDFETGDKTVEVVQSLMDLLGDGYYYEFIPQSLGVYQIIVGGYISGSLRIVARPVTVRHRYDQDAQAIYGQLFNRF